MPPLFAVLESEALVQELDKTRLDASKSFAAGVPVISGISIKPSKTAAAVDATSDGFLDWLYEFTVDVDAENNKLDFSEDAGELTATLTSGEYTLAELADEIATKLNAVGALTYVAEVSDDDEITIGASGAFSLLAATGSNAATSILPEIGFGGGDTLALAEHTGEEIERVEKQVTVSIENAASPTPDTASITKTISIISERADRLFSTDDMLRSREPGVMKFVKDGRATFKDIHREAQRLVLKWLDTQGFIDDIGDKITIARIQDTDEVSDWAAMIALRLIYEGLANATDDIFAEKAKRYGDSDHEDFYRNRAVLRLDLNQDGTVDSSEQLDPRSGVVVRR